MTGEHAAPWWWPTPGSADEDEWARQTLAVVLAVARRAALTMRGYHAGSIERDDLESWLVTSALEFRDEFTPDPAITTSQMLDHWLRVLYAVLFERAFWHFGSTHTKHGLRGTDRKRLILWQSSTDAPIEHEGEPGRATLGDLGAALWPAQRPIDPADRIIELETLRNLASRKARLKPGVADRLSWLEVLLVLDKVAPDPDAGMCAVWGCSNPPVNGNTVSTGLCGKHAYAARKQQADPCTIDGCDRWARTRGMCQAHYAKWRLERMGPCEIDGCDSPQKSRGLCSKHYGQAYEAGTLGRAYGHAGGDVQPSKECSVDGCTRPQTRRGLCNKHYGRLRRARKEAS